MAIADGERIIAETILTDDRGHSSSLIPVLDSILRKKGVALKEIKGIAVGIGPGSFTGIRMGLATARGLAVALGIPIRGVNSFDILLAGYAGAAGRVCPVLSAHSYGLYSALYEREGRKYQCVLEPLVCQPVELAGKVKGDVIFMGPDLGRFRETLQSLFGSRASFDDNDAFPMAAAAALLFESPRAIRDNEPPGINPLYILPGVKRKAAPRRVV